MIINKLKRYSYGFIKSTKGNALLLAISSAIAATFSIYFFVSMTTLDRESQERVAHLYNAYQMGVAVNTMIQNRLFTRGQLEINFQDSSGNYIYSKEEYEILIQLEADTVLTLKQMVHDDIITDADDPTATRLRFENTEYDKLNTKLKVVFDLVNDSYDQNGDVIKKVAGLNYMVNLAGLEVPDYAEYTNAPYDAGSPFYYLVSYADSDAGLTESDITLQYQGVIFKGVLDESTHGVGPQPDKVILLPSELK
ncbi:MAG: hypothetical protein VXX85_06825 [Candidatus Margulisiibacteriota bacterium]|nr:hypothetical protein [Candidatus Margulisiibacteriota bacterium]